MKFCIQDPRNGRVYLADDAELAPFAVSPDDYSLKVDVLLIVPGDELVQELPSSRLTDSDEPTVQIVDPSRNKSWLLTSADLQAFRVTAPPSDERDVAWFAMPSARELLAVVPIFRKALVQHGC
jgi:hypothetical protein